MTRKLLATLSLLILTISLVPTLAQDDQPTVRVWSPIESITAEMVEVETDEGAMLTTELTITGNHTDGCEYEVVSEQNLYPNNLDIQLYREIPIAATCIQQITPFEAVVTLDEPLTIDTPYLTINDQVWAVNFPEGDTVSSNDVPEFEELALFGVVVEDVTTSFVDGEEPAYLLSLSGSHAVGCDVPIIYNVRETADLTIVGVFNAMEEESVCPLLLRFLEDEVISIPATVVQPDTLVTVNEFIINELENQAMSDSSKVMTNINSVDVNVMESNPMQLSIEVAGEHPDGCDLPVMVDQERDDDTVFISIYREVPADMMCPMMLNPYEATIKIDGSFESGKYKIDVNGVVKSIDI